LFFISLICIDIGCGKYYTQQVRPGVYRHSRQRPRRGRDGIPIFKYKLLSFGISSFYAGFAGALWAYYMVSITTEPFNLGLSVEYIAMVIIGGMGNIPGAIFGATFITLLNELLRFLTGVLMNVPAITSLGLNMAPLKEFVFGLAIVLFI